jgi:hypothetical protein
MKEILRGLLVSFNETNKEESKEELLGHITFTLSNSSSRESVWSYEGEE